MHGAAGSGASALSFCSLRPLALTGAVSYKFGISGFGKDIQSGANRPHTRLSGCALNRAARTAVVWAYDGTLLYGVGKNSQLHRIDPRTAPADCLVRGTAAKACSAHAPRCRPAPPRWT